MRVETSFRLFGYPGLAIVCFLGAAAGGLSLVFSILRSEHEQIWNMSSFAFGMILVAAGVVAYALNHLLKPQGWATPAEKPQVAA